MNALREDYSLTRRTAGRRLAFAAGAALLGLAVYVARTQSMPEFGVYDGWWMLLWGTVAVLAAAPLVWRWNRERSLGVIAVAALIGCWAPLVVSALRHSMPIMARLKGSWVLAGAGIVGVAVPLGFLCLWLAVREHEPGAGRVP
ncbi:MAG: hypothetical protein ABI766_12470 [Gemmatimonadales bacterium]